MIASVFSSLSLSLFAVTHAFTSRKHSWTVWTAVRADVGSGSKGRYSSASSAKSFQQVSQFFVLLPSVKGEEDGTNTQPRGTPLVKSLSPENDWFTETCWVLLVRYEQNHWWTVLKMPTSSYSHIRRISWSVVLNAALRSKRAKCTKLPPSALHKTLLRTLRRQNHNCDLGGMLTETCQGHAGVDGINCSATAHSRSLEAQGRFKTGW